jgi:hypothetical protein
VRAPPSRRPPPCQPAGVAAVERGAHRPGQADAHGLLPVGDHDLAGLVHLQVAGTPGGWGGWGLRGGGWGGGGKQEGGGEAGGGWVSGEGRPRGPHRSRRAARLPASGGCLPGAQRVAPGALARRPFLSLCTVSNSPDVVAAHVQEELDLLAVRAVKHLPERAVRGVGAGGRGRGAGRQLSAARGFPKASSDALTCPPHASSPCSPPTYPAPRPNPHTPGPHPRTFCRSLTRRSGCTGTRASCACAATAAATSARAALSVSRLATSATVRRSSRGVSWRGVGGEGVMDGGGQQRARGRSRAPAAGSPRPRAPPAATARGGGGLPVTCATDAAMEPVTSTAGA